MRAAISSTNAISFEYSQGLLWVQVQIPQSARPLNFLFDTGASVSVISASTARALGLDTGKKIEVQGVHASLTGHWPAKLKARSGNVALPSEYLALNLSTLEHACRRPLDGLLGADFMQGRITEIDFASHQIRLLDRVTVKKSDTAIPLELCNNCFCLDVGVDDQEQQRVRLDTGCATALQWVTSGQVACEQSQKPAIGLAALAIPRVETTVSLGGRYFGHVLTGIHRQPIFAGEAGLLGNGLLSRFKTVTIDARAGRLILGELLMVY
jgi:hypothetical protein